VYWQVHAKVGWCVAFPEYTEEELRLLLVKVGSKAVVNIMSTTHGLYGDRIGLMFVGAKVTKAQRSSFLLLLEEECEFWRQQTFTVETMQRFSRVPLYLVCVGGGWKFVTLAEAQKLYAEERIHEGLIGAHVLESDLTCSEISAADIRAIKGL
jgi:hypothetical protein